MMRRIVTMVLVLGVMLVAGCQSGETYPDLSIYIDEVQEQAPDNEALARYLEDLQPIMETYYRESDGQQLETLEVRGNEIRIVVDLGGNPAPYETMEERMLYEVTRLTHSVFTYQKDLEALEDLYRITIRFVGEKSVVLYGGMTVEVEGVRQFRSKDVLDAVKRP